MMDEKFIDVNSVNEEAEKSKIIGLLSVLDQLEELQSLDQFLNVSIMDADNNITRFNVLILAAVSPFLHQLLTEVDKVSLEDEMKLILPDFGNREIDLFADLLHSGEYNSDLNELLTVLQCPYYDLDSQASMSLCQSTEMPAQHLLTAQNNIQIEQVLETEKQQLYLEHENKDAFSDTTYKPEIESKMDCDSKLEVKPTAKKNIKKRRKCTKEKAKCENCPKSFVNTVKLKQHLKLFHQKCVIQECDESFKTTRKTTFFESAREHVCHICAAKFAGIRTLQGHINNVHRPDHELFSCDLCHKQFNTKTNYRNHLLLHQQPTKQCSLCSKRFHTQNYLRGHFLRTHAPWNELPYACTKCEKGFMDKQVWRNHLSMHAGTTPYTCRYCPREYLNQSNQMAHEKKNHPDLYTKVSKVLGSTRIKDRMNGSVAALELDQRPLPWTKTGL